MIPKLLPDKLWPFGSKPDYDVRDKVVLVTGAGQGIGLELSKLLNQRGAKVAVLDLDEATATAAAESLGANAFPIAADVRDRAGMEKSIAQIVERFGRLDVVVANAGVVPKPGTLRTIGGDEFDQVVGVNLTGVYNTVHPALEQIVEHKGHVILVGSGAAFAPGMGGSPYMISKAGVEQFGRALRIELAAVGASAGLVYFGLVETELTFKTLDRDDIGRDLDKMLPWPLNRRITAEHAAKVIADAIKTRAARSMAPAGWDVYAALRGFANIVLDDQLAGDRKVHDIMRRVEKRNRPDA